MSHFVSADETATAGGSGRPGPLPKPFGDDIFRAPLHRARGVQAERIGRSVPLHIVPHQQHALHRRDHEPAMGEMRLPRSEEHTSDLQSLMRISYAVFCLKKKKTTQY